MIFFNRPGELYHAILPYRLAIISEKSGVNDAVNAALQSLKIRVDYLEMVGNASVTRALEYVRGIHSRYPGKQIVLFYLSDYDMAGRNMPYEFSLKLRYELERRAFLDGTPIPSVKVYHLALTEQQVKEYQLPPAPEIKDPQQAKFEIDALVQHHPKALENIIIEALERYEDPELRESCDTAMRERHDEWLKEAEGLLDDAEDEARGRYDRFAPDLKKAWSHVEAAMKTYEKAAKRRRRSIEAYNKRLSFRLDEEVLGKLRGSLDIELKTRDIPPPDCPLVDEIGRKA